MSAFRKHQTTDYANFAFNENEDGLCVVDRTGKILKSNHPAAFLLGYNSAEALIGANLQTITHLLPRTPQNSISGNQLLQSAITSCTPLATRDYQLAPENNQNPIPVELTLSPNTTQPDRVLFLLKLRNISAELERERAQSDFISVASHEMRTPIAAIEGYLSLALNPQISTIDAGARNCIESAYDSTKYLGGLFRNLLDISRFDEASYQPELITLELTEFIRKLSRSYEMLAKKRHHKFYLNLPSEKLYTRLDPILLQEVITNLIDNSLKYTRKGGLVFLTLRSDNANVYIDISDNGIGIAKENLPHLFDKFYRINGEISKVRGAGLGLYLVKQTVEKMHGQITVNSEKGVGTTFSLIFQRISPPSTTPPATPDSYTGLRPLTEQERNIDPSYKEVKRLQRLPALCDPKIVAYPFINTSKAWRDGKIPSTSEAKKQKLHQKLYDEFPNTSKARLEEVWKKYEPFLDNPGLSEVASRIKSPFSIPWLLNGLKASSWEFAFGWGYDIDGNWREMPKNLFRRFMVCDPEFVWVRERTLLTRREIADKDQVLFLNAGCLPELRYYPALPLPKATWACDEHQSIDPNNIFGWIPSAHNVRYTIASFFQYLDDLNAKDLSFDVVVMNGGTFDYYTELDNIINAVVKVLKPGGKFLFDTLVIHWDLIRAYSVFDVEPEKVSIPTTPEQAIAHIQKICDKIWGVKLSYIIDDTNKDPAGVMFCITNTGE